MEFSVSFLAIFAAALSGSFHCLGMCGGISLAVTESSFTQKMLYHGGRLLGYLGVGLLAGLLGEQFFFTPSMKIVGLILGWGMALALMVAGFLLVLNRALPLQIRWLPPVAELLYKLGLKTHPSFRAFFVGLASVFLPCGWLYTFVLLSLSTHSLLGGTLTLFVFWLGTLPALVPGPLLLNRALQRLELSGKKITGVMMILAGITSIYLHFLHDGRLEHGHAPGNPLLICR